LTGRIVDGQAVAAHENFAVLVHDVELNAGSRARIAVGCQIGRALGWWSLLGSYHLLVQLGGGHNAQFGLILAIFSVQDLVGDVVWSSEKVVCGKGAEFANGNGAGRVSG